MEVWGRNTFVIFLILSSFLMGINSERRFEFSRSKALPLRVKLIFEGLNPAKMQIDSHKICFPLKKIAEKYVVAFIQIKTILTILQCRFSCSVSKKASRTAISIGVHLFVDTTHDLRCF